MNNSADIQRRTLDIGRRIIRMFKTLPPKYEAQTIGKQVLRSGTSVGAHCREANRSRSKQEFIAKIGIALQELDETSYWLHLLAGEVLPVERLQPLIAEVDELIAILTTVHRKVKAKQSPNS